ncbi:hypothetical protein LCGC14_0618940 [marine sediment metagenome]|uniref:Uncharacterized protein n=1 Tax=marine sediment metagenome TaxID=412755 RepID=A0A0F9RAC3_9ZZZZ
MERIRTEIYNIYKAYLLKNILGEHAIKDIIEIYEDSETSLTKHLNSLLVRLTVKLLLKINKKSPIVFKFIEGAILDNNIILNTRYYLYSLVEQHFKSNLNNLRDFILRYLPSYFQDIEFSDGSDIIKAGFSQFLFQTHKTLSTYFPKRKFKFNLNFSGFTNGDILILKKDNNPYSTENYPVSFDTNNSENMVSNDKLYFDNKKYSIKLLHLGFALQIFKLLDFDVLSGLTINFPLAPDIPIKISYEDNNNILIYIFKSPIVAQIPHPKKVKSVRGRMGVVDLNKRKTYVK